MSRIRRKLAYPLVKAASFVKEVDPLENYLLFAEPRGGSTWLAQIVSLIPDTALLWEPINPRIYPELRGWGFGWRPHIPPGAEWPEVEAFFAAILRGKRVTYHTVSHTSPGAFLRARHLVVKFCRGNGLLPWMTERFEFVHRPVYFVRHPFAVVSSQLRHGAWADEPDRFRIPDARYGELYREHGSFLKSLTTKEEVLTARWCLANTGALEHPAQRERWIRIHYESLVQDPLPRVKRIFGEWGVPVPGGVADAVRRPSVTVRGSRPAGDPDRQLSRWQRELDVDQIERMQAVLDHFEVRVYSRDSVHPAVETGG